jgi:hypothetical protein
MRIGHRFGTKTTTSCYRSLDIRRLHRAGILKPNAFAMWQWSRDGQVTASIQVRSERNRVWLDYRHRRADEPWEAENYAVAVEWTPCHYGGSRPWFRCPALGCGRRAAILYGGEIFACRRCYGLVYDSQNDTRHGRALSRAQAIRVKLGGSPSLFEPFPAKPKGMHWRTYHGLLLRAEQAQNESWPPWMLNHILRGKAKGNGDSLR